MYFIDCLRDRCRGLVRQFWRWQAEPETSEVWTVIREVGEGSVNLFPSGVGVVEVFQTSELTAFDHELTAFDHLR